MPRLRHKSHRDRTCPQTFNAYARFGRIEEGAPRATLRHNGVACARVWLHVSGEFVPERVGGHRVPLLARYMDDDGHLLGWVRHEYRETPRGLMCERVETRSWAARTPFSAALVRTFDALGRPSMDMHTEQGRIAQHRHYRYDDEGVGALNVSTQASFVYDQQYGRDGGVMCATDFSPLGHGSWRCRIVHYPHRAHERVEEHRVLLMGLRPLSLVCAGGLGDVACLDVALTAGVARVTV